MRIVRSIFLLLVIAVVVLSGCTRCQKPYINFGNECCLDNNGNGLCDDAEDSTVGTVDDTADGRPIDTTDDGTADDVTDGTSDITADNTDTSTGDSGTTDDWVRIGANLDKYYASDYIFREYQRDYKLTEFEQTYNVYAPNALKFYIYEIKDESNFMNSYDDFLRFAENLHEMRLKEEKRINDEQVVKIREDSINNKNAYYNSSYDLKEVSVLGEKVLYESGLTLFLTQWGYYISPRFIYSAYYWCSPDMVVRIEAKKPLVAKQTTLDEPTAWSRMLPKLDDMEETLPTDIKWVKMACGK